jgi:hypothetical protein
MLAFSLAERYGELLDYIAVGGLNAADFIKSATFNPPIFVGEYQASIFRVQPLAILMTRFRTDFGFA